MLLGVLRCLSLSYSGGSTSVTAEDTHHSNPHPSSLLAAVGQEGVDQNATKYYFINRQLLGQHPKPCQMPCQFAGGARCKRLQALHIQREGD